MLLFICSCSVHVWNCKSVSLIQTCVVLVGLRVTGIVAIYFSIIRFLWTWHLKCGTKVGLNKLSCHTERIQKTITKVICPSFIWAASIISMTYKNFWRWIRKFSTVVVGTWKLVLVSGYFIIFTWLLVSLHSHYSIIKDACFRHEIILQCCISEHH